MEQRTTRLEPHLKRNRAAWFTELDRLRRHCRQADGEADSGSRAAFVILPSEPEVVDVNPAFIHWASFSGSLLLTGGRE
jgi:hypothetical protein